MHRLVIALTGLLGLTAAVYLGSYLLLFSAGSDRAASLAPADTAVYVNVWLQPSTGQQMRLADLIGRFPGFADDATLDEKVDQIVQNLLAETGINYRADLKPWLGNQVAVAVWFPDGDPEQQQAVAIVAVKDRAAAEEALPRLAEASGEAATSEEEHGGVPMQVGETTTYAFVEEMLVASDSTDAVREVIDTAAEGPSLAGVALFREAGRRLPADHLASAFVNPNAAMPTEAPEGEAACPEAIGPAGAALVAEQEGLRITGSWTQPSDAAAASDAPAPLPEDEGLAQWMPADTAAEVVLFDVAGMLAAAETAMACAPGGQEATDMLEAIRLLAAFGLGVDLDTEVLPLLEREAGLSFTGIDGEQIRLQLVVRPEDPVAGLALLDRMAERLSDGEETVTTVEGVEVVTISVPELGSVAYAGTDEVLVVGLTADDVAAALEARSGGSSLASDEEYTRAFELIGERGPTEAYLNIGTLIEGLGLAATLPDDARDILSQIGGLALTVLPQDGNQIEFHAVLIIEEDGAE